MIQKEVKTVWYVAIEKSNAKEADHCATGSVEPDLRIDDCFERYHITQEYKTIRTFTLSKLNTFSWILF